MVSKASDDFPDPDSPVKTTNLSRGMVRSTSFRLCSRAPRITMLAMFSLPLWGRVGVGAFDLPTDLRPHATGPRLVPLARPRSGRRRKRLSIFHGIPTQAHQPVAQLRRPLELQVAACLRPLA